MLTVVSGKAEMWIDDDHAVLTEGGFTRRTGPSQTRLPQRRFATSTYQRCPSFFDIRGDLRQRRCSAVANFKLTHYP
ncbi:hypothetical protein [Mesorhizobium sp. KR9-304]|uniref:hypothetical protein n=1 Tax=Mesorhizobium sp. KR9-304 TaxID=3156614 RepID=UPI0032B466DF